MPKKERRLSHGSTTRFGEERIPIGTIDIRVTSRCNFNCEFCFARDEVRGPDITFADFKRIINQIDEASKRLGQKPSICVGGGEPFLHKEIERMMSYAVGILGRDRVEITTNLSKIPTNPAEAEKLLARMGYPKINMSIDREHLRFGKQVKEKILSLAEAARRTGTKLGLISVATHPDEVGHFWPRSIKRVIPRKLKMGVKEYHSGYESRLEQYHGPKTNAQIVEFIDSLVKGTAGKHRPPMVIFYNTNLMPLGLHMPQKLSIANDGKVYICAGFRALFSPLLSIGSWRKENLADMVNHALPCCVALFCLLWVLFFHCLGAGG